MMKILGSCFIIGATTFAGFEKAKKESAQLKEMCYLQRIMCLLQSEIRYSRAYLGEIFLQIGQGLKDPYKRWLLDLSDQTVHFTEECFETLWKNSIDRHLKESVISKGEQETLKSLGNQLGYADVNLQIRLLDLYLEHLGHTIEDVRKEVKTKTKLFQSFGIMSGILVVILLL